MTNTIEDIKLYRSLFNTRDDVFAHYWEDIPDKKLGFTSVYWHELRVAFAKGGD